MDAETPRARKAERVALRHDDTIAQGLESIACSCLRHFEYNQHLIVQARDIDALHQARVALRRLRSAFALFRPLIADEESRWLEDELRWLLAELGDARNLDVYLERDLSVDQRQFAEERRQDAYDRAAAAISSARCQRLSLETRRWAARGAWRDHSIAEKKLDRFLDKRIDRLWAKVSASRHIARMNDGDRHRLRIKVKKLRYSLEFADPLHASRPRRKLKFSRTVKQVQQSLGCLHDIVTAASMMRLNSWLSTAQPSAKRQRRLVRDADEGMARLRRMGPYWHRDRKAPG